MDSEVRGEVGQQVESKPLYKGQWVERLSQGQVLPVGGSIFSTEMTTKLQLDFDAFEGDAQNYTEEKFREIFKEKEESFKNWYKQLNCELDPYLFFILFQVQMKVHQLLAVNPEKPYEAPGRAEVYQHNKSPRLSEFKGKSECAERAALGQWLLQRLGVDSAFMSGITMENAVDTDEYAGPHAWLMIKYQDEPLNYLVFDVARPKSQQSLPRILKGSVPLNYDTFKGKRDGLVQATEVFQDKKLWFGVGEPMVARSHNIIQAET